MNASPPVEPPSLPSSPSPSPSPTPPCERDPRVYFAAERTTLAWIRTGIAMMGFGFVVARFGLFLHEMAAMRSGNGIEAAVPDDGGAVLSRWAGTSLVLMGVFTIVAPTVRHFRFRARFERCEPFITPRGLMTAILATVLTALGLGMAVFLIAAGH